MQMAADFLNTFELSLVLAGGNALGAYHQGACEALLTGGFEPDWCMGTSIGAVTAAIISGNRPAERLSKLDAFWSQAAQVAPAFASQLPEEWRARHNNDQALAALAFGRPGLFHGRFPGILSVLPWMPPDLAFQDHQPLADTLERLIDFEFLHRSPMRLSILTLDMGTGDEVWFDNRHGEIGPRHLLAATALTPLFPPVEIDGRLLCDAGFGNNLPIDRALRDPRPGGQLCVAIDVYAATHGRPRSLDEAVARVQDLAFALQTRRTVAAVTRERTLIREVDPTSPPAILAHLAYLAPGHQRTLKPLDFSVTSLRERRDRGRRDAEDLLPRLAAAPRDAALAYIAPEAVRDTLP